MLFVSGFMLSIFLEKAFQFFFIFYEKLVKNKNLKIRMIYIEKTFYKKKLKCFFKKNRKHKTRNRKAFSK